MIFSRSPYARLGRMHDHRRLLLDPVATVDLLGELRQRAQARARARLREALLSGLDGGLALTGGEFGQEVLRVDARVPDFEEAHRRGPGHRLAVRLRGGARGRALLLAPVAVVASGDDEARDEALEIPLERRPQCLVEVVEIEHEASIRRREHAEVRQVRVTAALHTQARGRRLREIRRHDRRATAVERERRDDHAPVSDRHQLGHARRVLLLQDPDRVRTPVGGRPLGVRLQRHRLALGATLGHARLDRLRQIPRASVALLALGRLRAFLRLDRGLRHVPRDRPAPGEYPHHPIWVMCARVGRGTVIRP